MKQTENNPSVHLLVDYALGLLSPEESLEITRALEADRKSSATVEVLIRLVNLARNPHSDSYADTACRVSPGPST